MSDKELPRGCPECGGKLRLVETDMDRCVADCVCERCGPLKGITEEYMAGGTQVWPHIMREDYSAATKRRVRQKRLETLYSELAPHQKEWLAKQVGL